MLQSIGFLETTTAIAVSATFTGATRSATISTTTDSSYALLYTYFNAHFHLDQVGMCRIEGSNNESLWLPATASIANTVSVGVSLQVPVTYKFYRAVFINGITATTTQSITTSFVI